MADTICSEWLISIHALREEGDHGRAQVLQKRGISIHALREEGDAGLDEKMTALRISIHALREEGDRALAWLLLKIADFYPRPPRGGRPMIGGVIG